MAERTLHLVISSVSENLFDGPAISATLPGSAGEMTILPNHEPLISTLKAGKITVRIPNKKDRTFDITAGVLEISGERAVVLV
jgi:F-type H+-transporting ATPase subunit epsilon